MNMLHKCLLRLIFSMKIEIYAETVIGYFLMHNLNEFAFRLSYLSRLIEFDSYWVLQI